MMAGDKLSLMTKLNIIMMHGASCDVSKLEILIWSHDTPCINCEQLMHGVHMRSFGDVK